MGTDRALEVLAAGPLTLVQDLGRVGLAAVGVGRSGAADRAAFCLGARLLAQPYTAAALEATFGSLSVRAHGDVMLALTGAPAPADVDGRGVGYCGPFALSDGQILTLGTPRVGLVPTSRSAAGWTCRRYSDREPPTPCRDWDLKQCEPATSYGWDHHQSTSRMLTRRRQQRCQENRSSCTRCAARETTGSPTQTCLLRQSGSPPVQATGSGCAWRVSRCNTTPPRWARSCQARE